MELVVARSGTEETPGTPPSPSPIDRSPSAVSDTSKAGSDMVVRLLNKFITLQDSLLYVSVKFNFMCKKILSSSKFIVVYQLKMYAQILFFQPIYTLQR